MSGEDVQEASRRARGRRARLLRSGRSTPRDRSMNWVDNTTDRPRTHPKAELGVLRQCGDLPTRRRTMMIQKTRRPRTRRVMTPTRSPWRKLMVTDPDGHGEWVDQTPSDSRLLVRLLSTVADYDRAQWRKVGHGTGQKPRRKGVTSSGAVSSSNQWCTAGEA